MKFQVTAQHLAHVFDGLNLNHERVLSHLSLDLGHVQLLRDCYQAWETADEQFWLVLLALVDAVNQGSLCLDLKQPSVQQKLQRLGVEQVSELMRSIDWSELHLQQTAILHCENDCLYFAKYRQLEQQLQGALERLLRDYAGPEFTAQQVAAAARQVTDELSFEHIEARQVLAIVISLLQPFGIISGGPGTGKTTIMSSVLRALMLLGYRPEDVVLAAPTGRAANRMTESLHEVLSQHIKVVANTDQGLMDLEAKTIHRLLGARAGWRGFQYGAHNLVNCKLLVVDEVSMVDAALMRQLLQAVPLDCRVILLGDQFQLPSVDSGAVLADLMPPVGTTDQYSESMCQNLALALDGFACKSTLMAELTPVNTAHLLTDHVAVLTVSKRCQPDIAALSELVRQGRAEQMFESDLLQIAAEDFVEQTVEGVYFMAADSDFKTWQRNYLNWIKSHYFAQSTDFKALIKQLHGFDETQLTQYQTPLTQIFKLINSNRILTLVNESTVGSVQINEHITALMKQQLGVSGMQNRYHGSVIMLGQNNTTLGLFNGDVAILLASNNGQLRAVLPHQGGFISHSIHVLPRFTSAYAITVHKSQGSEFQHVLMPLPEDENHRLLTREIIYTGMTRAKQSVGIYAAPEALKMAVKRQTSRHSGLRFWYNQAP